MQGFSHPYVRGSPTHHHRSLARVNARRQWWARGHVCGLRARTAPRGYETAHEEFPELSGHRPG